MSQSLRTLHLALLQIIGVMNEPQRDEALIAAAGIRLDRALFPLLIGIERFGPVGIVQLAASMYRDHTTISRQVGKLEGLGLVTRAEGAADRRTRSVAVTPEGKAMTDRIDAAREKMLRSVFADWPAGEVEEFARLAAKYAQALRAR